MSHLASRRKALYLVTAIVLTLTLVGSARGFPRQFAAFAANLNAVNIIKYLSTTSQNETRPQASVGSLADCPVYPLTAATLQDARTAAAQRLEILNTRSWCWATARPTLAIGWRATLLGELGRDEEACKLLTDLKSTDGALAYARQSIDVGNWLSGKVYLRCVDEIAKLGMWVSPWRVAELYQRLGQHFEDVDQVDDAIAAYGEASYWHPGVWAMPYLRKAQLLWGQGKTVEAIDWLIAGIPRSTDATSAFYLWRELGEFMVARGAASDGLCAYQKARDVMDQVPSQNLPDTARQLTQERLYALAVQAGAAGSPCFEDYPELRAR